VVTGCTITALVMVGCLLGVLVGRWRRRSGCTTDDDDDDDDESRKAAETRRIVSRSDAAATSSTSSSWLCRIIRRARIGDAAARHDRCFGLLASLSSLSLQVYFFDLLRIRCGFVF